MVIDEEKPAGIVLSLGSETSPLSQSEHVRIVHALKRPSERGTTLSVKHALGFLYGACKEEEAEKGDWKGLAQLSRSLLREIERRDQEDARPNKPSTPRRAR